MFIEDQTEGVTFCSFVQFESHKLGFLSFWSSRAMSHVSWTWLRTCYVSWPLLKVLPPSSSKYWQYASSRLDLVIQRLAVNFGGSGSVKSHSTLCGFIVGNGKGISHVSALEKWTDLQLSHEQVIYKCLV